MKKKIDHVGLVLFDASAQGLRVGQRFDALDDLPPIEADAAVDPDTVWPEYDEPSVPLPGEWSGDARICLLATAPRPVTVGALVLPVLTNEK